MLKMISLFVLTFSFNSFAKERIKLSDKDKKEVIAVLKQNENLHGAFFNYTAARVESEAKALLKKMNAIGNPELAKLLKFARAKLSEINAKAEQDKNNQNYHIVSSAMIFIINKYDVGSSYNAYSCPMVKKKWVQNSMKLEESQNPYASNMPNCGVKDTKY